MSHAEETAPETTAEKIHACTAMVTTIMQEGLMLLNEMRPELPLLDPTEDHVFLGDRAVVDSMALVTYLNVVEGLLNSKLGINVEVISEKAMSMRTSPFHTTATLRKFLVEELANEGA